MSPSGKVLHTVREKEKNYTNSDQNDPDVVPPYAAYSPAGHVEVGPQSLQGLVTALRSSITLQFTPVMDVNSDLGLLIFVKL